MTDAVFYPYGNILQASKDKMKQSDLWPLVLTLYYNSGGKLFATYWDQSGPTIAKSVIMGTAAGVQAVYLKVTGGGSEKAYSILGLSDSIRALPATDTVIESKSIRYIAQKLRDETKGAGLTVKQMIDDAELRKLPDVIDTLVRTYLDNYNKYSHEDMNLHRISQEWLLHILLGGKTMADVPTDYQNDILLTWQRVEKQEKAFEKYLKDAAQMFDREKYFIARAGGQKGLLVGALHCASFVKVFRETYHNGRYLPSLFSKDAIDHAVVPFGVYDGLDNIPNSFRDNLMASLGLCKVNRENLNKKLDHLDKTHLIPITNEFWSDTDSMAYTAGQQSWFVCDKVP